MVLRRSPVIGGYIMELNRLKQSMEQLQTASSHLHYEVQMLHECARRLSELRNSDEEISLDDKTLENALIESFLIHARVLIDFFYVKSRLEANPNTNIRSSDVIAEDFLEKPNNWWSICPEKSPELEEVNPKVGKQVAHLTYDRSYITVKGKKWDIGRIYYALVDVIFVFIENVDRKYLDPKLLQIVDKSKNTKRRRILIPLASHTASTDHSVRMVRNPGKTILIDEEYGKF